MNTMKKSSKLPKQQSVHLLAVALKRLGIEGCCKEIQSTSSSDAEKSPERHSHKKVVLRFLVRVCLKVSAAVAVIK
jgi:hypothetical protein